MSFECCCTRTLDYISLKTMQHPRRWDHDRPKWQTFCSSSGEPHDRFASARFCPECGAKNESQHIPQPSVPVIDLEDPGFTSYGGSSSRAASSSKAASSSTSSLLCDNESSTGSSYRKKTSFQSYPLRQTESHRQASIKKTQPLSNTKPHAGIPALSQRSIVPIPAPTEPDIRLQVTIYQGKYRIEEDEDGEVSRTDYVWKKFGILL